MNYLQYILYIGVIYFVFSFAWKWIIVLPGVVIFTLIRVEKVIELEKVIWLLKILGAYLLVSLTALMTLSAIQNDNSEFSIFLYPLIGGFILYMIYASNYYESTFKMAMIKDEESVNFLQSFAQYEGYFIVGAIVFFVLSLFIPIIIYNPLVLWCFDVIAWIFSNKIFGWLIKWMAVLFLIKVIFDGIITSRVFIDNIISKFTDENEKKLRPDIDVPD